MAREATPTDAVILQRHGADEEGARLDGGADAVGDDLGAGAADVGQEDEELFAAVAGQDVARAQAAAHDLDEAHEHGVAAEVAVLVVDALEVVEVEQQRRQGRFGAARARDLLVADVEERAAVVDGGELVGHRQPLDLVLLALALQQQEAERHGERDGVAGEAGQRRQRRVHHVDHARRARMRGADASARRRRAAAASAPSVSRRAPRPGMATIRGAARAA